MENLTGGTPPVRYLPCVVPCKLYFTAFQILPMHFALPNQYAFNYLLMLYHNTFLKLYSYISEYMLSWGWGVSLLSNAAISTVKPLSATEK